MPPVGEPVELAPLPSQPARDSQAGTLDGFNQDIAAPLVADQDIAIVPPAPETTIYGAQPPARAWRQLAGLDLEECIRQPVLTVREPPRWFRGSLRKAFMVALRARHFRSAEAWKLFILTPRMLLRPTDEKGEPGKAVFFERLRRFMRGEWLDLLEDARSEG